MFLFRKGRRVCLPWRDRAPKGMPACPAPMIRTSKRLLFIIRVLARRIFVNLRARPSPDPAVPLASD